MPIGLGPNVPAVRFAFDLSVELQCKQALNLESLLVSTAAQGESLVAQETPAHPTPGALSV